jgi:hypothetical protein
MEPKAEAVVNIEHDLRTQIAETLREQCGLIVNDAVLVASCVSKGGLNSNDGALVDLRRVTLERSLSLAQPFRFTYAIERAVLEGLALDKSRGAPSEPWPLVAQLVRRASVRSAFRLFRAHPARAASVNIH